MSNKIAYTGWTEVDAGNILTVAADTITGALVALDSVAYVYHDYGASYWSGQYDFSFKFKCGSSSGAEIVYPFALLNGTVGAIGARLAAADDCHFLGYGSAVFTLGEQNGAALASDTSAGASPAIADGVEYTIRVCRDETVGTYGTLYAYIYLDPDMTILVDTLSVTLTEKQDFRYFYAFSSQGSSTSTTFNGYVKDLCLDANPYSLYALRTKVRDSLNESTAAFWTDAEINANINDSCREIAELAECQQFTQAISTTQNVRYVAYTGLACRALDYKPGSGARYSLIQRDARSFGKLQLDPSAPRVFQDLGGKVWIDPLPDATYNLDAYSVRQLSSELTADTQVPALPPAFRCEIVPAALSICLQKEQRAAAARQLYGIAVNETVYLKQLLLAPIPDARADSMYK